MRKLLTPANANAKTRKEAEGIEACILHLAPASLSGWNVCPWATAGCRDSCLNTSGRSQVTGDVTGDNLQRYAIHRARIERTRLFMQDRAAFLAKLGNELAALDRRARRLDVLGVVRLNGTSDIPWEHFVAMQDRFPGLQFYDYTKSHERMARRLRGGLPSNYHLTFSRAESKPDSVWERVCDRGGNVAIVFDVLPERWHGFDVIDGTANDWRFRDRPGCVVGLLPKGRAKRDESGFVVRIG